MSECGVESLSVSNAVSWERAWSRAGVHAVGVESAKDCWVRDVHSFASPLAEAEGNHLQGGGIYVGRSKANQRARLPHGKSPEPRWRWGRIPV